MVSIQVFFTQLINSPPTNIYPLKSYSKNKPADATVFSHTRRCTAGNSSRQSRPREDEYHDGYIQPLPKELG